MTDREAFEQWFRQHWPKGAAVFDYTDTPVQEAYVAWQAALAYARQVPEGWKIVPVDPVPNQIDAGSSVDLTDVSYDSNGYAYGVGECSAGDIYRAMIAAAPPAPPTAGEGE